MRNKLFVFVLVLFNLNFYQFVFAGNLTQDDVYKILTENGKKIDTIKFDFKQEIIDDKSEKNVVSGNIVYKTPNKFKVIYKKPEVEYVYNGTKLVIYDKAKNQVLINSKENKDFFGKEIIDFFKFDESLKNKYKITSYWEEDKFYCFIFTDIQTNYKVNLSIDKKQFYPRKIIWDKDYMKFVINLSDVKFDLKIDGLVFEFEIKDDMKVFDV